MILKIPLIESKKKIIDSYIKHSSKPSLEVFYFKGQIHYFEENWQQALEAFARTDQPKKYFYLGMINKNQSHWDRAEKNFLKSIEMMQDHSFFLRESKLMLADIYYTLRDYQKSYRWSSEVKGKSSLKYALLYAVLLAQNKKDKAKKIYQKLKQDQKKPQKMARLKKYFADSKITH